jgi:hypothetical protein
VDQISPPFRIALVAILAMCAVWFTVLKPKDPAADTAAPDPTAPGVTGLGNDVKAAKGAAAASDAANAKVRAATGGTAASDKTASKKAAPTGAHAAVAGKTVGAKPSTTAEPRAKAKAATGDASAPLLRALDAKHAVVLVFWNRRGSDDRAVRRAVAQIDRHDGKVIVKAAPIATVGRYEAITRGAQVLQSPTVLVMGPDRKARAIVGFTTTGELDQAVGDTLAAAKPAKPAK